SVAGQHQHAAGRLCQRDAEPDHRRAAHGAPEIEVERPLAGGGSIVAGRAEAGDDEQVARIAQQRAGDRAAIEGAVVSHFANTLAPTRRWENSTATGTALSNARAA